MTSLKLSWPAIVSASSGCKRWSTSTLTTLAARWQSCSVKTPTPGPISSTPQSGPMPAASAMRGQMPGLMMKFCPNSLDSENPYRAQRSRMVERSVRLGTGRFLSAAYCCPVMPMTVLTARLIWGSFSMVKS